MQSTITQDKNLWRLKERIEQLFERNPQSAQNAMEWFSNALPQRPELSDIFNGKAFTLDEDGWIEVEWQNGVKNLLICFEPARNYYLKSWGANMITEMEQGVFCDDSDFLSLWGWLQESLNAV